MVVMTLVPLLLLTLLCKRGVFTHSPLPWVFCPLPFLFYQLHLPQCRENESRFHYLCLKPVTAAISSFDISPDLLLLIWTWACSIQSGRHTNVPFHSITKYNFMLVLFISMNGQSLNRNACVLKSLKYFAQVRKRFNQYCIRLKLSSNIFVVQVVPSCYSSLHA